MFQTNFHYFFNYLNDVTSIAGNRISAGNTECRTGSRQNRRNTENAFDSGTAASFVEGHRHSEARVGHGPRRHVTSRRPRSRKHGRFRDRVGSGVGHFFLEFFDFFLFSHNCGLNVNKNVQLNATSLKTKRRITI